MKTSICACGDSDCQTCFPKTKHTPGPWKTSDVGVITGGTGSLTSIAETYLVNWLAAELRVKNAAAREGVTSDLSTCSDMVAEQKANSKLIAAAPDLLEALQRAVEHAESHDDYDWIGAAEAAIARATA